MTSNVRFLSDVNLGGSLTFSNSVSEFPEYPSLNTMIVKDGQTYIFGELSQGSGYNTWQPVGQKGKSHFHQQGGASTTWTIEHKFGTDQFAYFVYDSNHRLMIANIEIVDPDTANILLSEALTGTAVLFSVFSSMGTGGTGNGYTGSKGDTGATGLTGPAGATGLTGPQGTGVTVTGSVANLQALSQSGQAGQAYILVNTGNLAVWTGSVWSDVGKFTGPAGAVGATGLTGPAGTTGPAGGLGYTGSMGPSGVRGTTGSFSGTTTSSIITSNTTASTSTTSGALQVAGGAGIAGNVTIGKTLTAGNLFVAGSVLGHMIPDANRVYDLGSPTRQWKNIYTEDLHVGTDSLYVNGQKVLQDNSGTIVVSADSGQNLAVRTKGTGDIELSVEGGKIELKGDMHLNTGYSITSNEGLIRFMTPIMSDGLSSRTTNGILQLAGNGTGYVNVAGDLRVTGNMTVSGTTTSINTETLSVADNIIDLNSDYTGNNPTENAGIRVIRGGNNPAVQLRWNETEDKWQFTNDGANYTDIGTGTGYTGSIGPAGATGLTGNPGSQGPVGATGLTGPAGATGVTGYSGSVGYSGSIGASGATGYNGSIGYSGSIGASGATGYTGSTGGTSSPAFTGTATINSIEVGTKIVPQNIQSVDYTAVSSDNGGQIFHPSSDTTARTWTIPSNASVAYPIGTALTFINQNGAGAITIAINADTMRLAGTGGTGSRVLSANGIACAIKLTATEWIISGTGLA